jgi:hypothetical protein
MPRFPCGVGARPRLPDRIPGTPALADLHQLCQTTKAKGNAIPDAYLAAMAMEAGGDWITTDGGFSRFPGLQ